MADKDPFAAYQKPAGDDPFAAYQKPADPVPTSQAAPVSTFQSIKNSVKNMLQPGDESTVGGKAENYVKGGLMGLGSAAAHPINTVVGAAKDAAAAAVSPLPLPRDTSVPLPAVMQAGVDRLAPASDAIKKGLKENPAYTLGQLTAPLLLDKVGDVAGAKLPSAGELKAGLADKVRSVAQNTVGAGDRLTKDVVGKAADQFSTASGNAVDSNAAAADQLTRRRQLQDQVTQQTQALQNRVAGVKAAAKTANDAKWDGLRAKIGDAPADPAKLQAATQASLAVLPPEERSVFTKELQTQEPTPDPDESYGKLQTLQKNAAQGNDLSTASPDNPVTFSMLQNTYSNLGTKLSRGNLSGPVYNGLKDLRAAINDQMTETAAANGADGDLADARQSHADYMKAFGKNKAPQLTVDQANLKAANPQEFARQQQQMKIDAISKHDPDYATHYGALQDAQNRLGSFPSEKTLQASMKAPPDEPTVDLEAARRDQIAKASKSWGTFNARDIGIISSSVVAAPILHFLGAGSGELIPTALTAAYEGGKRVAAAQLDKPSVIDWLAKPRASDLDVINKIPGADRVRIANGFTDTALEKAQSGKPVTISSKLTPFLGDANIHRLAAAGVSMNAAHVQGAKNRKEALAQLSDVRAKLGLQ